MRRALTRIAHEIVEKNHGAAEIALSVILLRGVPLQSGWHCCCSRSKCSGSGRKVDIGLYRDDFAAHPTERPALAPSAIPSMSMTTIVLG